MSFKTYSVHIYAGYVAAPRRGFGPRAAESVPSGRLLSTLDQRSGKSAVPTVPTRLSINIRCGSLELLVTVIFKHALENTPPHAAERY